MGARPAPDPLLSSPSPHPPRPDAVTPSAIAYVLLACACFAVLDSTAKVVLAVVPVLMAFWVRCMLQSVFSTAMLLPGRGRALLKTKRPWMQLLRGLLLLSSSMLGMFGVQAMPVGEFTAIVMVTPLAVTLLAVLLFKERVAPLHWVFVLGGFAGTLLIVRPGGAGFGWAAVFPLLCMVSNSVYQIVTSLLARTDDPATTHFYSCWTGAAVSTLLLPFVWTVVELPRLWWLMGLMGVMASVGHFALATAYHHAPASAVVPYLYAHVGFAVLAGWLVFSHVPDAWSTAGIGLIAACGVGGAWLTLRSRRVPVVAAPGLSSAPPR